ncbi:16S rRNA (cytosine(1402)-N(4))-methyltransferase RsmH [Psychrobacter sp. AOP22-C1-22]|uniref:16S rRNA (cytosine(1402)-N(4))-methyltransferase RsmH n=1 Tax=unclassified Psychrobacter TaxID=196806 RepID=UPI002655D053|nr:MULTISPECIES: 16S rRNA (cytosine(1402)-N(4))-methyltransferase RsmH [unclassified Psychrobacter]MDN5800937.1 16S rRNA (cytosine(1402)-N(4))-methyltransferase RsmH [Psychrobacter sp.]MDN5891723.1 16S rRNA (cytosine(1402)-N(4))-methyltransferase RsmH [Psychrobacter sp.]MDN5897101.1 16S rRNA (cytosine(1402)-N(4))-methyltransferase RsmH [Psychrobacter sp.]
MSKLNNKPKNTPNPKVNPSSATDDSESMVIPSAVESASDNKPAQESATEQPTSDALSFVHDAVLLQEAVAAVLGVKSLPRQTDSDEQSSDSQKRLQMSGIYVDATFGRGGHSRLLLSQLADDATLIVFDKDPTAIGVAQELASIDSRVKVVHDSFATLTDSLAAMGIMQIDGLMADLGISSPQIDDGSRGFSFMRDGAVDMRMDTSRGQSVAEWLEKVDDETLANVLYEFGEERHSRRIARAIKQMDSYDSTLELAEVIKVAHPNWQRGKHPATQSFQAMRIFINNELGDVDDFLEQSIPILKSGGQLAVISFHSLEDRRIKQFLQRHSKGQYPEDENLPMPPKRPRYFSKPKRVGPSKAEISHNPRSRSAWLRMATRTDIDYLPNVES